MSWDDYAKAEAVLQEVLRERYVQEAKWGRQDHPNGTWKKAAEIHLGATAEAFKASYESAVRAKDVHWADILVEEVAEAFEEQDPVKLRTELLQVAAVAVAWIEAIDRRREREPQP